AALQTTAIPSGDGFVLNGSKIWNSYGHKADYCLLAARTRPDAPKHKGISMFLLDMRSRGISIRPLRDLAGRHHFNEVFFEDVWIPRTALLGEQDAGWYQLAVTLDFERSAISGTAGARRNLEDILRAFS